jgi:hypothetical protein
MRFSVIFAAITLPLMLLQAHAASPANAVEFKNALPTTMQELAAVNVLQDICPQLLDAGLQADFQKGYGRLLAELLPNIDTPLLAIQSLKDDNEYKPLLAEARQDAAAATVTENREVCLDVVHYPTPTSTAK